MVTNFKLKAGDLARLVNHNGGCLATDRITVDGADINYMYREATDREGDTGWRFFAGDESQEYIDDLTHTNVYALNTIANHEPAILEYVDTPPPCEFERIPGEKRFREIKK